MKYGTTRFQTHYMNSVLVETWEAFTVSSGNIIRDTFTKNNLLPPRPLNIIKNTHACVASVQTSSKGTNQIAEDTLEPIKLQLKRTNNPMVIIRAKDSTQQPSINILLPAAAYDTVQKRTVAPLHYMNREAMIILQNKKEKLENEDTDTRRKTDSTSEIYLTTVKVAQYR